MLPHALSRAGLGLIVLATAGCAARYSFNAVEVAKTALLGMDQKDIRMCAGFPNRSFTEDGVTIWSYDGPSRAGGVNVSAPILFGAANTNLSLPGNGNCRVQMRFIEGRLDRLAYSGDNDGPRGRNTICTPVVQGCLDYARSYKKGRTYGLATAPNAPQPKDADLLQTGSVNGSDVRTQSPRAGPNAGPGSSLHPSPDNAQHDDQDVRGN